MILETRARLFGQTDSIQVAILLQEDDYTSAAPKLSTGTVEILHGTTALFTETFTAQHRVLWFEGDQNYNAPEDRGQFYLFFHHPPLKQHMDVRVSVTMSDNRTATQKVPIDYQAATNDDTAEWQNPALSGRDTITFEKDPDFPYREQQ